MTDLTPEELRTAWKNEERRAQIKGWDFSHIEGRCIEEPLPWDYSAVIHTYLKDEMKQNPKLKKDFLDKFGQEDVIDKEYYIEKLDQVFRSGEDRSFVDFGIYNIDMMEYALSEFMDNELPKILEMREHSFASSLVEKIAEVLGDDLAVNHDSWYDLAEDFMEYVYILEDSIYLTSDERKSLESATSEIVSYL